MMFKSLHCFSFTGKGYIILDDESLLLSTQTRRHRDNHDD